MKLKNKKTGEIKEVEPITIGGFRSLVELNEEWEDYDGPKGIQCIYYVNHFDAAKLNGVIVGFETKEAEKAVEKLKAWTRLKDKGFRFKTWGWENKDRYSDYCVWFTLDNKDDTAKDLDLLFGGEE